MLVATDVNLWKQDFIVVGRFEEAKSALKNLVSSTCSKLVSLMTVTVGAQQDFNGSVRAQTVGLRPF